MGFFTLKTCAKTSGKYKGSHENIKLSALLLSAQLPDPTGYGRVVKDQEGNVIKVVEEKDATFEERLIREVNGGVYLFY